MQTTKITRPLQLYAFLAFNNEYVRALFYSRLTLKVMIPWQPLSRHSRVFIVVFERATYFYLESSLVTLSNYLSDGRLLAKMFN